MIDEPVKRRRRTSTRSVTMSDVARAAGVSAQTVSRALRHPATVSDEARSRVEAAVTRTGYVPNMAASHLASNRSMTVAAILPVISTSVFSDTLRAAAARLGPHGYQLLLGYTDYQTEAEEDLVRSFLSRRPDAFLIVGSLHTPTTVRLLTSYGVPVVETWDWEDDPIDLLVGYSNRSAMADMTRHVIDRGHRRIVFAGAVTAGDSRAARRLEGFKDAASELLPDEPLRVVDLPDLPISMDTGATLLATARERYPDLTALVFPSDVFASGALLAATRQGIQVPAELAITGFGDFDLAQHLVPSLTTVGIDAREIGSVAADLLLRRIDGQDVPDRVHLVDYHIIPRDST